MSGNNTVPGAAPAGAASAGYYTRPDLWTDAQKHQDDVEAHYLRLKHLEGGLQTQSKDIEDMTTALNYLQDKWQRAAKVWDTATMEAVKLQYDDLQKQMRRARLAYAESYGEYDKEYQGYVSAWNTQSEYVSGQKAAEQQWRSTIRDPEAVLSELETIEGQIAAQRETDRVKRQAEYEAAQKPKPWYEKLAGYLGEISDTTLPTYNSQNVSAGAASPELQALLEKQKLLQEEYEWAMYLPYADLMQEADFAEKSQYRSTYRGGEQFNNLSGTYTDTGFDDIAYDYINRDETARSRQGLSDLQSNAALLGLDSSERGEMTDEEIAIFNYIYATQGKESAYEYIEYLTGDLNARQRAAQEAQWAEYAKERPGAASAFSVMMSPVKGLSYLGQAADYLADGRMDQNAGYNQFSYIPGSIREQVAGDIKASAKTEFWGGVGSFGYQTAMSMADFLTTTLVSGGNSTLAMAIMGSGAAADTVIEAKDRGLNDNQAFALGTIAGVAEAVTEKFSLDTLLDKTSLGKSAVGYVFKNVVAEGSEEVTSSLINTMADVLISKDKSQWQTAVDAYEAQGKTEGQAFGLALADQALALGLDFLGGALSGGVMAGGNVAISKGTSAIANRLNQKQQAAAPATFQEEVQRQVSDHMTAKSALGTVDTAGAVGYDYSVNETKGGDISHEGREETREAFHRRAHEAKYTVRERGEIASAYTPAANKTERAGRTEKALQELGIQVIVHDGLEINADGRTISVQGEATSVGGDAVYVRNSMQTDSMETAGHEAFHFWKHADARITYREVIEDNIDFSSDAFADFLQKVEKAYFGEEVGIDDDGADKLAEEIYAYITGLIHSGSGESIVRPFLRDYDAVKAAWDALAHSQASTAAPATFQEEVQRQVSENMGAGKAAQAGAVELDTPTVRSSEQQWQQCQRLAQLTGRKITLYEGAAGENGWFDPKTGRIGVNVNGGDVSAQVFSHELTHSIEQAGAYAKLSKLVLQRMEATGIDLDVARENKRQQYQRQGKSLLTQAAVDQELVAEYVSRNLLTDEQSIASLVQQDRSLGQKIKGWFDGLLAKLGNKNAQERVFLERARNLYAKALGQTQTVGAAQTAQTEAVQPAGEADVAGDDFLDNLDAQLAAGEITGEEYDGIREEYERWKEEQYLASERKYSLGDEASQQRKFVPGIVVRNEIEANIQSIAEMDAVVSIQGNEFKMGDRHLLTDVTNFFDSIGGLVHNERLGDVHLRKRGVKNDLGHGMSDEKAASFAAIPAVLEKGKIAGFVVNKGGKGYDSATIVAPISIGGEAYMMGVIVHRSNGENRFYVHDVVAIKEEAAPLITGTRKSGESGGTTSTISIIRRILNVKKQFSLSEQSQADTGQDDLRYSLAEDAGEEKTTLRDAMPRKAAEILKRTERELLWAIADRMSVPKLAGREYLLPIIQEMADEYLQKGSVSPETRQLLFEKAYSQAVIVDAEFYEQYKHIKDHLRTTPVTISDRDKLDIADFNDFRKRAFGSLKIVNEGGLPVDAAYQELQSMAPELFPESITHPADQLVRMYDASRSIQVTEKTVKDYFGKYEPEYRKGAQSAFEEALDEACGKLWEVRRFAEEKAAKQKETAPATEQEAMEAYKQLKQARRDFEKVSARNLLTESDQMQVGRLLKHEILPEHLKEGQDNVKGILAVFEAKQEYERLTKLVTEYKRHLRGKARARADELLKTANSWKDKKVGIAYSRETMERNVIDIIADKALARQVIDTYFTPVHTSEAQSTRFKQEYRDRVRGMDISRKVQKGNLVSEAYAVQLLGEAQDNLRMLENARGRIKQRDGKNRHEWQAVIDKLWEENPLLDRGKIERAVGEFRNIYDRLFQQMNQVRVANGYEPVNYRQGYFPHFQPGDSDSILAQFGRALGIDTRIDMLPTTINGMTHAFKPGIQWFGNAQERLGVETAYDAVEGFDKYIEGVANVIHHTANIQNLRAFASQIRYRTSDEGIRKQVDEIYERQGLTDEEKQQLITEIYAHGKFALSGLVAELDEYTNLLAGKKSRYDRAIEAAMGRKAYSVLKAWESRVAANMIAGNLTSALTNFIPWTQAGAQVGYTRLLRGVADTMQATRSDDGFAGGSTFLTNRRGVDPLVKTWAQKASGIASWPMEIIDSLVSESIVRAAYAQNRQQGLSEAESMAQADAFAASVMADRSKGAIPTLFHSNNPLMKAFTQFQLEVNNQFSEVFKDIPRRYKDKKLRALVWVLLKYFLGAWLYNVLYGKLIGRRPALDPIGMLCQFGEDWKEDGLSTAGSNLASEALGQLPFASGLMLIGVETDGGRLPASSAVIDLTAIWKAATTEGWSAEKRWKEVQDELNKLAYVVPPFGGNQIGKIYKGVKAYIQGGSYTVDAEGNDVLQYPVYKDNPGDAFASFVKATILGKSSLGTAQEWVDKGFISLGAKQTAAYQDMLEAGVSDREAYALIRQISGAKETDTMKKTEVQRDALRQSQVSGDGKAIVYYGLMASEKEREVMDLLTDMGADAGAAANALMDMADVRAKDGSKQADVLAAISKAVLSDQEKAVLVGSVIGTEMLTAEGNLTQYAKFSYAVENGMGVDQYIRYRASGASIDDYLELRDAGASVEDAMEAAMALQELKDSVEDPTTVQKWKAVIAGVSDPEKQMRALSIVMSDSQYAKAKTARGFGVSPADFVSANEKIARYDWDGNGRLTQAEVTQGISNLRLTTQQKAVLWQLITGSGSAKNNPFSQAIGERVIAALEKAKTEGEKPGRSFQEEIMRQIMGK